MLTRGALTLACGAVLGAIVHSLALAAAPVLRPIPEIVASEGTPYVGLLLLDDWVADAEAADAELSWGVAGGGELRVRLTAERHLVIQPPSVDWFGRAELVLTVCNPAGVCATQTLSARVENVPDSPVIERIPSQVADTAEPFVPLDLDLFGWDPDGREGLTWSVAAPDPLQAVLEGSVLTITRPMPADSGPWIGTAEVCVTLEDSDGRAATRAIPFVVEDHPVIVTFIGNEGFLIESGGIRILIDALVNEGIFLTANERERLRGALYPFDEIDLALATHTHYDHFDPATVAAFLAASPRTVFISLDESIDKLRSIASLDVCSGRLVGIPFREGEKSGHDIGGVHVMAYSVTHGAGRSNLAFLVEIGGMRVLHLGDASADVSPEALAAQFGWASLGIDVALVPYWWLLDTSRADRVTTAIAPRFVIPMHFQGACPSLEGIETAAVALNLCREFETWIVPPRSAAP